MPGSCALTSESSEPVRAESFCNLNFRHLWVDSPPTSDKCILDLQSIFRSVSRKRFVGEKKVRFNISKSLNTVTIC